MGLGRRLKIGLGIPVNFSDAEIKDAVSVAHAEIHARERAAAGRIVRHLSPEQQAITAGLNFRSSEDLHTEARKSFSQAEYARAAALASLAGFALQREILGTQPELTDSVSLVSGPLPEGE